MPVSEADNVAHWTGAPGEHEAWFLTLHDPPSARGYWIRSALLAPRAGPASAGVWFARFDRADPDLTFGIHRRHRIGWATVAPDAFDVRIGSSVMRSGHASGSLQDTDHRVEWDLEYATGEPSYRPLPDLLYHLPGPSTRPLVPNVDVRISGTITVDGTTVELHRAPGQQGHVAGSRLPERWAWAHCADFVDEDAVVHAVTAQARRGPIVWPYLTFVGVRWQGRWIRLMKVSRRRDFGLGKWRVDLGSRRYRLTGRIEAPARAMVRARYDGADRSVRHCHNSGIASARLALFERRAGGFEEIALLESRGTTHAEWAGRTAALPVERVVAEVER